MHSHRRTWLADNNGHFRSHAHRTVCPRRRRPGQRRAIRHCATWPPKIRSSDHTHLTAKVGGPGALKTEWEAWWEQLLKAHPEMSPELGPPGFRAFSNSPALRRVLQAHFGAALSWARERRGEYVALEAEREAGGGVQLLADMVDDRLMEVGRAPGIST